MVTGARVVGIDDGELHGLLVDAGMPEAEVPRLLGRMNAHWASGGSIDALLADDDALRSWRLSPGSLMLLRSILGISMEARTKSRSKRGREESESFAASMRASLSLLRVDPQTSRNGPHPAVARWTSLKLVGGQ